MIYTIRLYLYDSPMTKPAVRTEILHVVRKENVTVPNNHVGSDRKKMPLSSFQFSPCLNMNAGVFLGKTILMCVII